MKALFDIGNSRIKWAWFDQNQKQFEAQLDLHDIGGADHAELSFEEMAAVNWSDWPQPEQVVVSSVGADEHWRQLQDWCLQHWRQMPVRIISPAKGCGVQNAYERPEELGSDRWAALVGAHHLLHADVCVVDCGTAITVDFLDARGQHLGGYIVPGFQLMRQSLIRGTDAIQAPAWPVGAGEKTKISSQPGTSTAECIENGIMMAIAGLIENACKKMQMRTRLSFRCLLTGGNAQWLAGCLAKDLQLESNLVLLGLSQIARKNCGLNSTCRDN